jgi:excisionase family DNA binding protein
MKNNMSNSQSPTPIPNPHEQINQKHPILENAVYTSEETQSILSISRSTFLRLIKKELLRANKIGGQYRVLGKEILRMLLPKEEFEKVKGFVERNEE